MKKLKDFETLSKAKEHKEYKTIRSGTASQFFAITGGKKLVETALANPAKADQQVMIIDGLPTTLGELLEMFMEKVKTGSFTTDPDTPEGSVNRYVANLFVVQGVFPQKWVDEFFLRGEKMPFADIEQEELDAAKAPPVELAPHSVEYPNGNVTPPYHVKRASENTDLTVILDEVSTEDVKIKIYLHKHVPNTNPEEFISSGTHVATIDIKAGQLSNDQVINKSYTTKARFTAISDNNTAYRLVVSKAY